MYFYGLQEIDIFNFSLDLFFHLYFVLLMGTMTHPTKKKPKKVHRPPGTKQPEDKCSTVEGQVIKIRD